MDISNDGREQPRGDLWILEVLRTSEEKPIVSFRGWSFYTMNNGFVAANYGEHDAGPKAVYSDSLDALVERILQLIGI